MGLLRAFRAAAGGKHPGNKAATGVLAVVRGLIFAVVTLVVATVSSSASYAQSGPFAGMAGNWSGGGTVTLNGGDGRSGQELVRCPNRTALPAPGAQTTYADNAGNDVEIGSHFPWKPLRRLRDLVS